MAVTSDTWQEAASALSELQAGTVKSWLDDRGMGFIAPSSGGQDLFVHRSNLVDGESLRVGAQVMFSPGWDSSKGKPIALTCVGAIPAATGVVPGGKGGVSLPPAPAPVNMAPPDGLENGVVKAWLEDRGMGFITPASGQADVFVHRSNIINGQSLVPGQPVMFESAWDSVKNKAIAKRVSMTALGPAPIAFPAQPAPAVEQPGDNLFISGLPLTMTEESIKQIFGAYGALISCKVMPSNGKPDIAALVRMEQWSRQSGWWTM
jgi:cold shock CspA family protein